MRRIFFAWLACLFNLAIYTHLLFNTTYRYPPGITVVFALLGGVSLGMFAAVSFEFFPRVYARLF
jgi:hypothetical protein